MADVTTTVAYLRDLSVELRTVANEIDHHEYGPHWRVNRDICNHAANALDIVRERLSVASTTTEEQTS